MELHGSLVDVIIEKAKLFNRGITFILSEEKEVYVSYKDLIDKSLLVLNCLQKSGLNVGDNLVFQVKDNQDFLVHFFACLLGGIIPIPLPIGYNEESKEKILKIWSIIDTPYLLADSRTISEFLSFLESNGFLDEIQEIESHTILLAENITDNEKGIIYNAVPDDIAFIQFSSGSTGDPKGVVLTHDNILTNIKQMMKAWQISPNDRPLNWISLYHDLGLIAIALTNMCAGIDQFIMPTSLFISRPDLWLKKASEHKVSMLYSPNFGFKHFLDNYNFETEETLDLSSVRFILNGAEPISLKLCNEFLDKLSIYGLSKNCMTPGYGLAEATVGVSFIPLGEDLIAYNLDRKHLGVGQKIKVVTDTQNADYITFVDIGYAVEGCEMRICDNNNNVLGDNVIGFLQIRGRNVTRGYYKNNEATKSIFTEDNWLITGDLGFINENRIVITGRAKDILFINGQNYYPYDIERAVDALKKPGIEELASCGVFNESIQRDEIILFALYRGDFKEFVSMAEDIKKHIRYKMGLEIKYIIPLMELPKTLSGKLQRYRLGSMYKEGCFESVINEINLLKDTIKVEKDISIQLDDLEKNITEIFKRILKIENISTEEHFLTINSNSLLLTQIVNEINKLYPSSIDIQDIFAYPTISKLASYLKNKEDILFTGIKLPDEFINNKINFSDAQKSFEFELQDSTVSELYNVCEKMQVEIEDFFLLSLSYVFSTISDSDDKKITIYTVFENVNEANCIDILFDKNKDIYSLVKDINYTRKLKQKKCYLLKDIENIKISRNANYVLPIIYHKKLLGANLNLCNIYDMAIEVEKGKSISFKCYNNGKLKKDKLQQMLNAYLALLNEMIESSK